MHRILYMLLPFLVPLTATSQQWKTFTDTAGKFTASYPSSWTNKVKEGNRVFFTSPADSASDYFYENININVTQKAGYGTSIKVRDLFPTVTNGIKKEFTDFKQESLKFFKWNNTDAAEIIYSGHNKLDASIVIRTIQWYCFYRSRLYMVTYVADAKNSSHTETARRIMNSILFR